MPPIQHWSDDIWVAQLQADEVSLTDELTQLYQSLESAEVMPHVVIDLALVKHMASSHLSQLLQVRKLAITRDHKLRLSCPSDQLWALFLTTGLDKVFTFTEDVSTALADLQISG